MMFIVLENIGCDVCCHGLHYIILHLTTIQGFPCLLYFVLINLEEFINKGGLHLLTKNGNIWIKS